MSDLTCFLISIVLYTFTLYSISIASFSGGVYVHAFVRVHYTSYRYWIAGTLTLDFCLEIYNDFHFILWRIHMGLNPQELDGCTYPRFFRTIVKSLFLQFLVPSHFFGFNPTHSFERLLTSMCTGGYTSIPRTVRL